MAKKVKSKKSPLKRVCVFFGKIILSFFILTIVLALLYRWVNPPVTPLMIIRKVSHQTPINKQWVDIEAISPYFIRAAIAAEDNHFLAHNGFDYGAIEKAITDRQAGKRRRGASTISQQTAKNVFLPHHASWIRKGFEVYFTVLIETFWSKERIMEVYLNIAEMGNGIYGCQAASKHYFHTSAKKVTARQAALITACYPSPRKRNPARPTNYLNRRADKILFLMPKMGKIAFDQETIAQAKERYQQQEEKRKAKKKH